MKTRPQKPPFELRCLSHALALVKRVRLLNLGVLPVQCPEFCYTRAARDPHELSWAAVVPSTPNTPSDADASAVVVAGALVAEFEPLNHTVHVRTLAVAPQFRRQGVGLRLVRQLLAQAQRLRLQLRTSDQKERQTLTNVQLHVHVGNADALAFYAHVGFQETARLENYYRRLEPRACLVMTYALPEDKEDMKDKEVNTVSS